MVLLITLNPLLQLFFVSCYQVSSINGLQWFVCFLVHPILLIIYFRYLNKSYSRSLFLTFDFVHIKTIRNNWSNQRDSECTFVQIFNINTPVKGIRLNDEYSFPLTHNDSRSAFLAKVVEWLDIWKKLPGKYGKLSAQAFNSFRHACILLPKFVNHLIGNSGFTYVLSSRLLNDTIEHHFGLYRMMSSV